MRRASSTRPPLPDYFEIVVIGGGINGVAIARQCALSGRRVLLLERNDFASGTTSRSTRIIHGGLRYLEHAEIALVRESLRERERLLRLHPNLVRPMDFVIALEDGNRRSALEIRAGLWLYRKLAGVRPPARAGVELQQLERLLDSGQRWSLFHYEDAQCEFPERLVAEWLIDAIEAGAIVHVWLGENEPDPKAIESFVTKTFRNTQCSQIAFSPEFTVCESCGRPSRGLAAQCPLCGSMDVYGVTRIVGYFSKVQTWNHSKVGELYDRVRTDMTGEMRM